MHILHVISQHPESTGSGFYLQQLLRMTAAAGHRNSLVAGVSGESAPTLAGVDRESCHFVRFSSGALPFNVPGMSDVMPYPSSRFKDLSSDDLEGYEKAFTRAIAAAEATAPIDVVHSHHLWLVSSLARRLLTDIPMVTSCHSTDLRQFVQCPHLQEQVLIGCRHIDMVLALSNDQEARIRKLYGIGKERIKLVGSGFDERLFYLEKKPPVPPVQVLYAGKLSFAKGVDWLLRVFRSFDERPVQLQLVGSGFGAEARECLRRAQTLGANVVVHGALSQRDLAVLMRRCHVFVLPSFYEGLPLVLLEALAAGCRIVTTDLPGCREVLSSVSPDLAGFVDLPELQTIDRPATTDWPELDARLEQTLQSMIDRVLLNPDLSPDQVLRVVEGARWKDVFARIALAYDELRQNRCLR